jgi:glycosyltransferase involved in cell wall biosynthesis
LRERGWRASFWCTKPSPLYDDLVALGYEVDGAPRLMRYRLRSLRDPPGVRRRVASLFTSLAGFRRHLRAVRPDLVHVNGRLALPEALVARMSGYQVVTYILDDALPGWRGTLGRLGPWVAAHDVIATSQRHADSLRLRGRNPRIVYTSTPLPDDVAARTERRPGQPVVVGTLGLISPRKGTDLFVEMARLLREQDSPVELRVAGGMEPSYLREWALDQIRAGEPLGIEFLGHVDDPEAELRQWDIMVLPSRGDPFPLSVLEAMAYSIPVVGADVEGISEQLADGAGVLVPAEDARALADAVHALALDPERRAALGAAGARRVREHFTIGHSADALEHAWRAHVADTAATSE